MKTFAIIKLFYDRGFIKLSVAKQVSNNYMCGYIKTIRKV